MLCYIKFMKKEYSKHTNGCRVSHITIDNSSVFDTVTIQFGFIWNPFKEFIIKVKYQDMGNHTGADFSNLVELKEKIKKQSCGSFTIQPIEGMGMLFVFSNEKIFIPMYDYISDYYDNDVAMEITYREYSKDGSVEKEEKTEINPSEMINKRY